MAIISAQVSLYPLRQVDLGPAIRDAVRTFRDYELETLVGAMSTIVGGEESKVFAALQAAFRRAAEQGDVVMVVTFSNACPRPKGALDA